MKNEKSYDWHKFLADDLVNVFFKLLRENPKMPTQEIMRIVPLQKAPRFYVSFATARRHLSCIKKGKPIWEKTTSRKNLYAEIYKRWKKLNNGLDFEKNSYKGLMDIILSPAPQFYLDGWTARQIIYKRLRKKKNEKN